MKALILNGCKSDHDESALVLDLILKELEILKWDITSISLEDKDINFCVGCYGCLVQTPGKCLIKDDEEIIMKHYVQSDLLIYLSPIIFGGYSSILKKAIDRKISILLTKMVKRNGETRHPRRYKKKQYLLGIGLLDTHDSKKEDIFKSLVARNALNMWAVFQRAIIHSKGENLLEFRDNLNKALREVETIQ
ncbi:MAG: flavodoxin family protein [Candidatus Lokiarchaeota archaeon]|nr:flavodoxin family protein [Candidatus Lokiarchaeota archaeon]